MAGARDTFEALDDEDLELLLRFILADGSIKDLAAAMGVSYPTMRQRLDGVLARVRAASKGAEIDPVDAYLADLISRGAISPAHARRVRDLHRASIDRNRPGPASAPGKERR